LRPVPDEVDQVWINFRFTNFAAEGGRRGDQLGEEPRTTR
jgi:hypothetical protein